MTTNQKAILGDILALAQDFEDGPNPIGDTERPLIFAIAALVLVIEKIDGIGLGR